VFHYSKLSRVVFFKGSQYDVLCICTCVTHLNSNERSYVHIVTASDNHLNDTQKIYSNRNF